MTTDWRAELSAERARVAQWQRIALNWMGVAQARVDPWPAPGVYSRPVLPTDRCGCGHTRAAHTAAGVLDQLPAELDPAELAPGHRLGVTTACALMCCGCEIFRGETDR